MSQRNSKSQDEISRLLDSFEVGDTLEEKMDTFKQEKERKSRIDRARNEQASFQRASTEEVDLTQVMDPVEEPLRMEDDSRTRTMMWDRQEMDEEIQDTNKTVVINDEEIQSLLDEEKGPKLTREVRKKSGMKKASSGPDKKTIAVVVAGVVGVLLTGLLIFGVIKLIGNLSDGDRISEQQQKESFQEILSWANDYDALSDFEKASIIDFESKFNKLTDQQQNEIDQVLRNMTGHSFDELLAQAKSDAKDKEISKNDNTKIAEKKAKLKAKIRELRSDLGSAQKDLDKANEEYSNALTHLNEISGKITSANAAVSEAQSRLDSANASKADLDAQLDQLMKDADAGLITNVEFTTKRTELNAKSSEVINEINEAKANLDQVRADNNVDSLMGQQKEASSSVDKAQAKVNEAQSKYDSINSELQGVQSELDAL